MKSMIPYTQATFNKIANTSKRMHNGQFTDAPVQNYIGIQSNTAGNEFVTSFINDLDLFIQSVLYDVDIKKKVKKYVDKQMYRYGQYIGKGMLGNISNIDMKYAHIFKERDYVQGLLIPYLYDNVMITD